MKQKEAIKKLKEVFSDQDLIFTQLEHVSKSGMTRWIKVRFIKDDYPYDYSYLAAVALGWSFTDRYQAVKVEGSGMDMGFHLVESLSWVLFGRGHALKQRWF